MAKKRKSRTKQPEVTVQSQSAEKVESKRRSSMINVVGSDSNSDTAVLLANEAPTSKWKNWWIRTFYTVLMISGFIGVLLAGHVWVILLVVGLQIQIYREVISIANEPARIKQIPWFRSMSWYFLLSTNYFLYGESCIYYFKQTILVDAFLLPLTKHHRLISFTLYCIGFILFVLNLKKGHYKFQFSQFGWTHMTLLFVVCQSHFIINNILEGMFWFLLPVALVVCNDIMAYIFGFFFGRTPLIRISPKKTWEGFLGAFASTVIFAFFISGLLASSSYLICPAKKLTFSFYQAVEQCKPNPVFLFDRYQLSPAMEAFIRRVFKMDVQYVWIAPVQLHALALASFSSLIAPFGGFFASGVKRSFQIKDFGSSIPGHGGLTDRMDCQFIMGLFSYIYFHSFVGHGSALRVGNILQSAITRLDPESQVELFYSLREYLVGQRLLEPSQTA